jgi:glucokinase
MTAAIGVDVGGTKIAAGLVTDTGQLLSHTAVPTGTRRRAEEILADAVGAADAMATEASRTGIAVTGVGIGVPEIVDTRGQITTSAVLDWLDVPVSRAFAHIGPTVVVADVRAAAYAESLAGAGRGLGNFVYVSVGTGISHTLVQDGKPYEGSRGAALLLGSTTMFDEPLEFIASGPAITAAYAALTGRSRDAEEVLAAEAADEKARHVVEVAASALGHAVAVLIDILDPAAIIVGGGLGNADGSYWHVMEQTARRRLWLPAARDIPMLRAGLGPHSGEIGAALFAARPGQGSTPPPDVEP